MENGGSLRPEQYFSDLAADNVNKHLQPKERTLKEALAAACRVVALKEEDAGLAGQISARSERENAYWTLRYGLGFDEATPDDFIEVDGDLNTISGQGMANPATRFHLWVYSARPDVQSIVHTHSPWTAALAAAGKPLEIAQMDMTLFYNDIAFLDTWPGTPIADQEGVLISAALGKKKSIILINHGQLTTGVSIQEAAVLSVSLERSAQIQIRAAALGPLKTISGELAQEAHDYKLRPKVIKATFDYWARQAERAYGPISSVTVPAHF